MTDTLPYSIFLEGPSGNHLRLLERGTECPVKKEWHVTTNEPEQSQIQMTLLIGDAQESDNYRVMQRYVLGPLTPEPARAFVAKVELVIEGGKYTCQAWDAKSGERVQLIPIQK